MLHIHACCKRMFQVFQVFHTSVASVFIWMLHMFAMFFQVFFQCFCKCFRHMFQVFYLSSFVCCNCCIWIFQKYIGCCTWDVRGKRLAARGDVWGGAGLLLGRSLAIPTRWGARSLAEQVPSNTNILDRTSRR